MKNHKKRNAFTAIAFLFTGLFVQAQCPAPTAVTANPVQICPGGTSTLNVTSVSGAVSWYTVPVGGTPVATHKTYTNFTVNPSSTTTYYAEEAYVYVHHSSGAHTFTVPAGITTVTFEAIGAQGGSFSSLNGGYGGYAKAVFTVTPGDVFYTNVGTPGGSTGGAAGGNGGGSGSATGGGGGGGASDVRFGGTALSDRILVAGGGGGAFSDGTSGIAGGNGGGLIGADGKGVNALSCGNFTVPTGGSQTGHGNGGTSDCANNGANGAPGVGGNGYSLNAGGGGGGYYGGGGGHENMSGAGGSNYVATSALSYSHAQGYNGGYGSVRIYYDCLSALRTAVTVSVKPSPVISVNDGTICAGTSFTMVPSGADTYTFTGGSAEVSPLTSTSYSVTGTLDGCVSSNTAVSHVSVTPAPVITVNSGELCAGKSFTLVPSGADTYTYSGGSDVVSPTSNTSYSVTGTSLDGCVSISPAVSDLTVHALPVISVNDGAICIGESFTLVASGADTYTYSSGSVVTPTQNSTYSVTGTSIFGCEGSNTAVSTVTVHALPVVSVNSGAICEGEVLLLVPAGAVSYTSSGGDFTVSPHSSTTYSVWGTSADGCIGTAVSDITVHTLPSVIVNSGEICTGESFVIVPSGAISYTYSGGSATVTPLNTTSYSVTGSNADGCVGIAISDVTVHALPTVVISGANAICKGSSTTLTAGGASSYSWNTTATTSSVSVTPTLTTTYSVTGTDANGCSNSTTKTLTVHALPSVVITGANTVCAGSEAILVGSGTASYSWSTSGTAATISVTPAQTTSYSVTGTDANGCKGTATHTVVVKALPVLTVTSTYSMICAGNSTSLTVSGGSLYTWSTSETTAEITVTPTISTSYTVATVGANGCANKAVFTQSVSECTGISKQDAAGKASISAYPNPNNGSFTIHSDSEITLVLINELGQQISTLSLNATNAYTASVADLPAGIYFAIGTDGTQSITQKIIVSK